MSWRACLCVVSGIVTAPLLLPTASHAATPSSLHLQGLARDTAGDPVADGLYEFHFAIYDDSSGGGEVWSESQPSVVIANSVFSARLGSVVPLTDVVFAGGNRWLQIAIAGDPPLPRIGFAASPYAFRVATVDSARGGTVVGDLQVTGKAAIGSGHSSTGTMAFVAGADNSAAGEYAVIGGGRANSANGAYSSVDGGQGNAATGDWNVVGGGQENNAGDYWSTIGGGFHNWVGAGSTIGGGWTNAAGGLYSTIGGGSWNRTWGQFAVVAGGGGTSIEDSNSAIGNYSVIGGGRRNVAGGLAGTVAGGQSNTTTGSFGTIPGGVANTAARLAFAAGRHASATEIGSFVWADSLMDFITAPAPNTFTVRASGGIWLGANSAPSISPTDFINTSTGAHLTTGGAWTNSSDAAQKENFRNIDTDELLAKLAGLPVQQWNYKAEGADVRHIGPTAQDFSDRFGLGTDDKSIATIDADGVALAAIQALYRTTQELDARTARVETLESELMALRRLVQEMLNDRQ